MYAVPSNPSIDYKKDYSLLIAIDKPEPGLTDRIISMIAEREFLSDERVVGSQEELAVISFYMEGTHETRRDPSTLTQNEVYYEKQVVEIERELQKNRTDYVLLYGEQSGDGVEFDTLLINTGRLALDLVHYHEKRAAEGELPKKNWDYSIWLSISDKYHVPHEDDQNARSAPESWCVEYILPLSRIVIARELDRQLKNTGGWTNVPRAGPATSPRFSEQCCRLSIEATAMMLEVIRERESQ